MVDMRFPTHRFWWHVFRHAHFHPRHFYERLAVDFWVRFKSCDD